MADKRTNIVTIKEIAKKANISVGTVDRVIHKRGRVSKETIEKVDKIIKELAYKPNIYARNLALNKEFEFAALIPNPGEIEYWAGPLQGLEKGADELYSLGVTIKKYLYNSNDPISFKEQYEKILSSNCDGVILVPIFRDESLVFIQQCKLKSIPFIFIDTNIPELSPLSFIGQDSYSGGYMAARLMGNDRKVKKCIILNLTYTKSSHFRASERVKGFKSFFEEHDNKTEIIEYSETNLMKLKESLKHDSVISNESGIFFPNSQAHKITDIIDNLDIQDKIKVVGFDLTEKNIALLKKGYIDFLINQNPVKQGYFAVNTLYNHIVLKQPVKQLQLMPLHITVKENYINYLD